MALDPIGVTAGVSVDSDGTGCRGGIGVGAGLDAIVDADVSAAAVFLPFPLDRATTVSSSMVLLEPQLYLGL